MGLLNKSPYSRAGLGLLIAGVVIALPAYFLLALTWLTALAISMVIMSFILLALGKTIPKLSPEVCNLVLETGIDNMSAIIEELGIRNKAIYLPSSLTGNRPQALIPLNSGQSLPPINKILNQRLIVKYATGPDDFGLLLSTIGSIAAGLLASAPSPDADDLESAMNSLLTGILGMADGASAAVQDGQVTIVIRNPRVEDVSTWSNRCLGSPLASIAASITAEAWDKPVTIKQEEPLGKNYSVILEVLK